MNEERRSYDNGVAVAIKNIETNISDMRVEQRGMTENIYREIKDVSTKLQSEAMDRTKSIGKMGERVGILEDRDEQRDNREKRRDKRTGLIAGFAGSTIIGIKMTWDWVTARIGQ